jgi:hypothetical protein
MTSFLISFIIWAVLHSLTAASRFKAAVRQKIGDRAYEGLYRLFYNVFSVITILPVLYLLATQVSAVSIWKIAPPFSYMMIGIQLIGLAGLIMALWQTDIWDFAGLRQALHYLSDNEKSLAPPKLVTSWVYRF